MLSTSNKFLECITDGLFYTLKCEALSPTLIKQIRKERLNNNHQSIAISSSPKWLLAVAVARVGPGAPEWGLWRLRERQ